MDFQITTGFGTTPHWKNLGLSADQVRELNSIGYSGKTTDGRKIDYETYLNSLEDGHRYQVRCLKQNNAEATATYRITRVDAGEVAGIESFHITTGLGKSRDWAALGLSDAQIDELNTIGYTGKSSAGERTTFEAYLNSIAEECRYEVTRTHRDTGDFMEKYLVKRFALSGSAEQAVETGAVEQAAEAAAAPAVAPAPGDNASFPAESLASAMVRSVRADADGVRVELVTFVDVGEYEQDRADKTVALAPGESMLLGTSEGRGRKVETHLHVDESGRAGIEFRYQAWNKPLFVTDAAGVEIDDAEAANGVVRGTFYFPGTRIELSGVDAAGWRADGNTLTREQGGVEMKLTDVFRSLDGEQYRAGRLLFSCPVGSDEIELGRMKGREFRVQLEGANVVGLSDTRWTQPSVDFEGVLLKLRDGYRVVELGAVGYRQMDLVLDSAQQAALDRAFGGDKVMFPGTRVVGVVEKQGEMKVDEMQLGPRRDRPQAPLWVVAQTQPELLQP